MSRPLSADERALWRRVVADVRPAGTPSAPRPAAPSLPPAAGLAAAPVSARPKRIGTTLDASWDRKLRGGQILPDRVVDLHGHTLDAAHRRVLDAIGAAADAGDRIVVLITGRPPKPGTSRLDLPLRGIIRASVHDWLAASSYAGRIAAVRAAHRRHGGDGAIYVVLRRNKSPNA